MMSTEEVSTAAIQKKVVPIYRDYRRISNFGTKCGRKPFGRFCLDGHGNRERCQQCEHREAVQKIDDIPCEITPVFGRCREKKNRRKCGTCFFYRSNGRRRIEPEI